MDRERIERWLRSGHRTWRWREDWEDPDHHVGLESRDAGFRWFAWSHLHGEDGQTREQTQTFEAFLADGPLWPMPEELEREVRDWLTTRGS